MASILTDNNYTGKVFGDMLVLNYHEKKKAYYVRILIDGKYRIARASEYEILNNIIPEKIFGKLVGNPFIHYDDGSTVLYDINGAEIIIDTDDFDSVSTITWRSHTSKGRGGCELDKYAYGGKWDKENEKWIHYALHRYILDVLDEDIQVDHINFDVLNNRRSNLRVATQSENMQHRNTFSNNERKVRGVREDKRRGSFQARITVEGKQVYLGESFDIKEAERLRLEAEKKYFGQFSVADQEIDNEQMKGEL